MDQPKRLEMWFSRAVKMENDSAAYYQEAAQSALDWQLSDFFTNMAYQESLHAQIIRNLARQTGYNSGLLRLHLEETESVEQSLKRLYENIIRSLPQADADILRAIEDSIGFETQAIDFYDQARAAALDEVEEKLLITLGNEEREHRRLLSRVLDFYGGPVAWRDRGPEVVLKRG